MDFTKRNRIRVSGNGEQPVLFAHGFGCDQSMWRHVVPEFEPDYKTVVFDHVGSGASDHGAYVDAKYSSLNGYAEDILEICQALDLKDVLFVGHSVSSMMGMLAAIAQPERFQALVMIGPSPCYINDGEYQGGFDRADIDDLLHFLESNYVGWSKAMAKVIMGRPDRPEFSEELANSFCQADPEIAKKFARVTFLADNRADLDKLKTRTLILQCREDAIAPPMVGAYVHKHIANSELVLLKAKGHCPNLSAPYETVEAIREFLGTL
jgi:sigma-B regulation protein RsbQ